MDDLITLNPNSQTQNIIKLIPLHPDDDEDEESLSLCNFPMDSDRKDSLSKTNRRSSSEPADFFEFLHHFTSDNVISHADDIFFCGKLLPSSSFAANAATDHHGHRFLIKSHSEHNHCSSSSTTDQSSHHSSKFAAVSGRPYPPLRKRHSRSQDHRPADIRRTLSKSSDKSESSRDSRPKWFVLMFGPLKFQQELDFRRGRVRSGRKTCLDAGDGTPANRRSTGRRSFWSHDLLKVLSCKNDASVAVTASIGLVPHFQ